MLWSLTIIRELALNLAKVIFIKTFGAITSLFIMRLCGSMSWNGMCCMLCRMQHTPFHDMLPHNSIINNDVISPNVLINITLARFSASSLMMVEKRNI